MSRESSRLQDTLKNRLDHIDVPQRIPQTVLLRAKRRRIVTSVATGAVALVLGAGAVFAATSIPGSERSELPPAESPPICSRQQIEDIVTNVSNPTGTGGGHPGVLFEVRVTGHDAECQPTLYIELDDVPALPPDGEGPDADEFRSSSIYLDSENPCLTTDHVKGDFLYTGEHTIEVGVGCDPDEQWPHETQEVIRFDGDTHERIDEGHGKTADSYPLVAEAEGTKVFAPTQQPFGLCPQNAQDLAAADLPGTEAAILLAKDDITGRGLNTEDASTDSVLASDHPGPPDFARMITRDCDPSLVERTALVTLRLPKVDSASMGTSTYFVSKETRGWVIWSMW